MKSRSLISWFSLSLILLAGLFGNAQKITTFDVPDGFGLYPAAISQGGDMAGNYVTFDWRYRGFLRSSNGKITTFDTLPGYVTTVYAQNVQGLTVGACTLQIPDQLGITHAFMRDSKGNLTLFDMPGIGTATSPTSINEVGKVAGGWISDAGTPLVRKHGFIREPDGRLVAVDAGGPDNPDTWITAINAAGQTVGYYDKYVLGVDEAHGFVRAADGAITTFDVLNATNTLPVAINLNGFIAGNYKIADLGVQRGFLRTPDGTITTFGVPGAVLNGTSVVGIDLKGRIAGYFVDSNSVFHGFVRKLDGTIDTFDVPGARYTLATAINPQGVIAGVWADAQNTSHGFVLVQ